MGQEHGTTEISTRVKKQHRTFTRRKLQELRKFYKSVLAGKGSEKTKMQAATRLQELYVLELQERQLEDAAAQAAPATPDLKTKVLQELQARVDAKKALEAANAAA